MAGSGKSILVFSLGVVISASLVNTLPRKTLVESSDTHRTDDNLVSSVLSDYWSERGFKDTLADHLIASESSPKELMLTGDEIEDFKGAAQIRIPRERLLPPSIHGVSDATASWRNRQLRQPARARLTPAQRKQDLEILESVTLVDGGTLKDGKIRMRPASVSTSQRKYHITQANEEISPLSYHLQEETPYKSKDQQNQPSISSSYYTLPYHEQSPTPYRSQQQFFSQAKPSVFQKGPKSIQQLTVSDFQHQLLQHHQPSHPLYSTPPVTPSPRPNPQSAAPIYVIPPPSTQPSILLQAQQQKQQKEQPFNTQLFQQSFKHPFQASQPSTLAQLTASLINTASAAGAVASAAATALANSDLGKSAPAIFPASSINFPALSLPTPAPLGQPRHPQLSPASSQSIPHILAPTSPTPSILHPSPLRPGVVSDAADQAVIDNQVVEPENLAARLTRLYETGRKIFYFPKGVIDTVDTVLKQMERNPTVAYWGDKFFAKVFGDTSGT